MSITDKNISWYVTYSHLLILKGSNTVPPFSEVHVSSKCVSIEASEPHAFPETFISCEMTSPTCNTTTMNILSSHKFVDEEKKYFAHFFWRVMSWVEIFQLTEFPIDRSIASQIYNAALSNSCKYFFIFMKFITSSTTSK